MEDIEDFGQAFKGPSIGCNCDIAELFDSFFVSSILDIRTSIPSTDDWSAVGLPAVDCIMTTYC